MFINLATQLAATLILAGAIMLIISRILLRLYWHTKKGKQYIQQPLIGKMQKTSILLILVAIPIMIVIWLATK